MAKHSYPIQKGRKLPIKRKSRKGRKSKWLPVVLNWIKKVFGDAGSAGEPVAALARVRPWSKPLCGVAPYALILLLLSACTATQVVGTLSSGGKVIKEYARGQITYKQEHRALTRRTVERGQSILMDEAELLVRQGKHDKGIMVIEKTLKFLDRNTPLLGQVLLDKDLLALKRARLDREIRKLEPKK